MPRRRRLQNALRCCRRHGPRHLYPALADRRATQTQRRRLRRSRPRRPRPRRRNRRTPRRRPVHEQPLPPPLRPRNRRLVQIATAQICRGAARCAPNAQPDREAPRRIFFSENPYFVNSFAVGRTAKRSFGELSPLRICFFTSPLPLRVPSPPPRARTLLSASTRALSPPTSMPLSDPASPVA